MIIRPSMSPPYTPGCCCKRDNFYCYTYTVCFVDIDINFCWHKWQLPDFVVRWNFLVVELSSHPEINPYNDIVRQERRAVSKLEVNFLYFCTFCALYVLTFFPSFFGLFVLLYFWTFLFGWTVHMNFHAKSVALKMTELWVLLYLCTFLYFLYFCNLSIFKRLYSPNLLLFKDRKFGQLCGIYSRSK